MSRVCEICGKHPVASRTVSHSHRVVNRQHIPNIQDVYVVVDGERRKMKVCTKCMKSGRVVRG
ncbi:MAG: 50S ribosomal protein L28 [Coriobacteriales bacterium]|nr:50S ribosomal protein L28 [Coriobacteriales bacterium]